MAKRGKTPSLIGGGAGTSKFVVVKGTRKCKRCDVRITKGCQCIEVSKPGSQGHKTYCRRCFGNILDQTQKDIDKLRDNLGSIAT